MKYLLSICFAFVVGFGTLTAQNITQIEYFFNTDPGYGLGKQITAFTSAATVADVTANIDVSTLPNGVNVMYIRTKDANGRWSITNSWAFVKSNVATPSNITQIEYFFNADPGYGLGKQITGFTPAATVADVTANIDISTLQLGQNILYIRAKDVNGIWSITNAFTFTKTALTPVTLLSFDAIANNKSVVNDWLTTNEVNTSHFIVERSTDGSSFTDIGKVNAKGGGSYSYTDNLSTINYQPPTIYYRLQMVDKDGSFTYSKIVSCQLSVNSKPLVVYPNPAKENLFVQLFATNTETVTIQITDMQGKVLHQQVQSLAIGSNSFSISTINLAKGSYTLIVKGQTVQQKQFVKE